MKIKNPKQCSNCGYVHFEVPANAKKTDMGMWFDCLGGCGSTFLSHPKNWCLEEEVVGFVNKNEKTVGHSYDVHIDDTPWATVVVRNGDSGSIVIVELGPSALKDLADKLFTASVLLMQTPYWQQIHKGEDNGQSEAQ